MIKAFRPNALHTASRWALLVVHGSPERWRIPLSSPSRMPVSPLTLSPFGQGVSYDLLEGVGGFQIKSSAEVLLDTLGG